MRLKESRIGEFIRHEGQEDRHSCNQCGTNGLLMNLIKNAWYCFGCGVGGKLDSMIEADLPATGARWRNSERRQVSLKELLKVSWSPPSTLSRTGFGVPPGNVFLGKYIGWDTTPLLDDSQGRLQFYGKLCPSTFQEPCYFLRPNYTALDNSTYPVGTGGYAAWDLMVDEEDEAGILIYQPDHDLRYRTVGTRGLLVFGDPTRARICMVVEGLFDALAILAASGSPEDLVVVATLGKDVTEYQIDLLYHIQRVSGVDMTCVIGLDRDAHLEAVSLMLKMVAFGGIFVVMPQYGKDWDCLYRVVPGGAPCLKRQIDFVLRRPVG